MWKRRSLFVATALAALVSAASAPIDPRPAHAGPADRGVLRIGSEAARPPFHFLDADKQFQGMEIEIARAICARIGRSCEFEQIDWEELVPALEKNRVDLVVSSMHITAARRARVWFSKPLYTMPWVFVGRRGEKPVMLTPELLKKRTIGIVQNTPAVDFLASWAPGAVARVYATAVEASLDLSHQRIDFVLIARDFATTWLNETEEGSCCHVVSEAPRDEALVGRGIGIALRPRERDLRREIDDAITAIRADGTMKEIVGRWFLFDLW